MKWWQTILMTIAPKVVDLFGKIVDKVGKKTEPKPSKEDDS